MKPKLYIETTIPSYLTSHPSRDLIVAGHQQVTHDWWDERRQDFDIYISQFVLDEAARGDPETAAHRLELLAEAEALDVTDEVGVLAAELIDRGVLPGKATNDALHISVATVHGIDFLMTWNCTHIANAEIVYALRRVCSELNYSVPVICTPEELLGD